MRRCLVGALLSLLGAAGCGQEELVDVENQPPEAVVLAPLDARAGEVVTLDGSQSSDPDGSIVAFTWDFGDGTTGDGETTSHIFAAAGQVTVKLTVTDDLGAEGSDEAVVTVAANTPPVAVIDGPTAAIVDESATFSGASSSDADGSIASYEWYVSDGTVGSGAQLEHAFTSAELHHHPHGHQRRRRRGRGHSRRHGGGGRDRLQRHLELVPGGRGPARPRGGCARPRRSTLRSAAASTRPTRSPAPSPPTTT